MMAHLDFTEINLRVLDQRIGMGVGGRDTIIRVLHMPTGIVIEMPRVMGSQSGDRDLAFEGLSLMLNRIEEWRVSNYIIEGYVLQDKV